MNRHVGSVLIRLSKQILVLSMIFCILVGSMGCSSMKKFDKDDVNYVTEVWNCVEIPFESNKEYSDPLNDVEMDVVFSLDGLDMKIPAFWDGEKTWKVRFAPPKVGKWEYLTSCTDSENSALNAVSGTVGCNEYTGDLEVYKHGFVKTSDKRYMTYADDTPFFYLGDTHWGMPTEELEGVGEINEADAEKVQGIESHFKWLVDKRAQQGFTVYQSEPIGAKYDLSNGVSEKDLKGFHELDQMFSHIAQQGLVHANAQLFFSSTIIKDYSSEKQDYILYSDDELRVLSRYWVARFGAWPVIWTIAQECDNDFYFERRDQTAFDADRNPWKKVAEFVHQYDAYSHPLSAHMEYANPDALPDDLTVAGVNPLNSSFKDIEGHSWWAIQWSPDYQNKQDFRLPKMFWQDEKNKPSINYEGAYDHLWTLEFGARAQGWLSFLNGMYGYGYGCADQWLYNSTYDMDLDTVRGNVTITVNDKKMKWYDSVNLPSAAQVVYMKDFLIEKDWNNLVPRFDEQEWSTMDDECFYVLASDGNDKYVAYFYAQTTKTGILHGMDDSADYEAVWFNPRDNSYQDIGSVDSENGSWIIPEKPDANDWVLCVEK